jgi:hypothetical protein
MRIFHSIPWNSEKNIGIYYNDFMSLLNEDDWACFLDGDAVHTTTYFGRNIEETIKKNQQYSLFTCKTNRVAIKYQTPDDVDKISNDQKYHRDFGQKLWEKEKTNVTDITDKQLLSGVLICLSKKAWLKVGGFSTENMLGVDNDIHKKMFINDLKVGIMDGIYVQHWYRNGDIKETAHLLKTK